MVEADEGSSRLQAPGAARSVPLPQVWHMSPEEFDEAVRIMSEAVWDEAKWSAEAVVMLEELLHRGYQIEPPKFEVLAGCMWPSCENFGDPDFGEGTCPAEHADPP